MRSKEAKFSFTVTSFVGGGFVVAGIGGTAFLKELPGGGDGGGGAIDDLHALHPVALFGGDLEELLELTGLLLQIVVVVVISICRHAVRY